MQKEQLHLFQQVSKITLIISICAIVIYFFLQNIKTTQEPQIAPDIAQSIQLIQSEVKSGQISEAEAKIKLIKLLKNQKAENEKLNDGSIESILKKFEYMNPQMAEELREKIVETHGEEVLEK